MWYNQKHENSDFYLHLERGQVQAGLHSLDAFVLLRHYDLLFKTFMAIELASLNLRQHF